MEEWTIYVDSVRYASRPTYDEARKVVKEQYNLIKRFGSSITIVRTVIPFKHESDNNAKKT